MLVNDILSKYRREYGLRNYNGQRIGCSRVLRGHTGPCSRKRHLYNHQVDGKQLAAWDVIIRVKEDDRND